jgi:predicted secreted hydrolase
MIIKQTVYVILIIAMSLLLLWKRSPVLTDADENKIVSPGVYTSMKFEELRKVMPERVNYINEKSTFLEPYDKNKLEFISDKMKTSTGEQMIALMFNIPNGELGYFRVDPAKQPAPLSSFQFEQGMTGWFWIYGTFIDSAGSTASFMYYLVRLDMFPPELREKLGLPLGSTTYYYLVGGVGKGSQWRYTPFKICRGEYTVKSDSNFSFTALDLPEGWKYTLQMNGYGKFKIEARWLDDSSKAQGLSMALNNSRQAFFNGEDGCAPCAGGAGTLYFSYTELKSEGTMVIDSVSSNYINGTSWVDRQWMNRQVTSVYLSLASNTSSLFEPEARGLGKYIWLNLHLKPELQYMVSGIFNADEVITKGSVFEGITNRYGPDNKIEYALNCKTTVLDTVVIGGTAFPIKYSIETPDGTFILDGSKFNKSLSIDPSNNPHWNGSGLVYDTTGKLVGSGFLEANQFQDKDTYLANLFKSIGVENTEQNRQLFSTSKLSLSRALPSVLVLAIIAIAIVVLVILFLRNLYKMLLKKS